MSSQAMITNTYRKKRQKFLIDNTPIPALKYVVFGEGGHWIDQPKTCRITSGSSTVTGIDVTSMKAGMQITHSYLPSGSQIADIGTDRIILNQEASGGEGEEVTALFSGSLLEDADRKTLAKEIHRQPIDQRKEAGPYACHIIGILNETQLNGKFISEFGILDFDEDLVAYFTFGPNLKSAGEVYQQMITFKE